MLGVALTAGSSVDAQSTIRQYQLERDGQAFRLVMRTVPRPVAGERQVLVRVRAASLNQRDLAVLRGQYGQPGGTMDNRVPLSDGAGEVLAVGRGATRFTVGDRVAGTFFTRWLDGKRTAAVAASARGGGGIDGMLSEMIVSDEDALVRIPDHLSFEEAATLPCAAVTAYRALFIDGEITPLDVVLLEGTGGVSMFGLQLAVAAGARPIITSSSDDKLEVAKKLGAFGTVNYRTHPEWQTAVREITLGNGVDHVLDVGGKGTLPRALEALGFEGRIALIGGLSGFGADIPSGRLLGSGARAIGIYVGSRADFEAMNRLLSEKQIKPVIDRVFLFEEAPQAYDFMDHESYVGKIVIRI